MGLKAILSKFFNKYLCSTEWKCLSCGVEIFDDKGFCEKCYNELPFNDGYICNHCGRKVVTPENYCSTCKEKLLSMDKGRSVFNYDKPISTMIKGLKYNNKRYLIDYFAKQLIARCCVQCNESFKNCDLYTLLDNNMFPTCNLAKNCPYKYIPEKDRVKKEKDKTKISKRKQKKLKNKYDEDEEIYEYNTK